MSTQIWVFAEQRDGQLAGVVPELLGAACRLAEAADEGVEISSILIGHQVSHLVQELFRWGSHRVFVADDERLRVYSNETYGEILERLIQEETPDVLLIGSTSKGAELAPTVAAKVKTGLAAHCVEIRFSPDGQLVQVVPSFGGRIMAEILCPEHRPQIATIKPGVMEKGQYRKDLVGEEVKIDVDGMLDGLEFRITPIEEGYQPSTGKSLESADIVVAGGWGIGSKADWKLIEELAAVLGGAVGCTRPPVDEGWVKSDDSMIGTSGKTVKPRVYIGIGVSGATHHVCGMKDSGTVISINKDPEADIFAVSDYAVVGDFREIVPLLVKRAKGGSN